MENNKRDDLGDIDKDNSEKNIYGAGKNDIEDSENMYKGEGQMREELQAEGQDTAQKAENNEPEAKDNKAKNEFDDKNITEQMSEEAQGAAHMYEPLSASKVAPTKKKRSGKGFIIGITAACVAAVLIFGAAMGAASSLFLSGIFTAIDDGKNKDNTPPGAATTADEIITIVKNDGGVVLNRDESNTPKEELSTVEVVEKVAASVVEVSTLTTSNYGQYVSSGAGSGVIIAVSDKYSYIVTNYHIVGGSDAIIVRLTDKREMSATYIDGDESIDLAIIKIEETEGISVAEIGSSSNLKVGQDVVAIGNPLGQLGGTVTDGIISALDREITVGDSTMVLLQTNAAVNPGNSGGGLFNMAGQLIGIVNAKQSAEGIEGLGFAIPIDYVYEDICEVLKDGYIHGRVALDIKVVYLTAFEAYYTFRTADAKAGIYISSSGDSRFLSGDRIVSINSTNITNEADYDAVIKTLKVGDELVFKLERTERVDNKIQMSVVDVSFTAEEYVPVSAK